MLESRARQEEWILHRWGCSLPLSLGWWSVKGLNGRAASIKRPPTARACDTTGIIGKAQSCSGENTLRRERHKCRKCSCKCETTSRAACPPGCPSCTPHDVRNKRQNQREAASVYLILKAPSSKHQNGAL